VKRALKKHGNCESRLQLIREMIEARGGNFGLDELPSGLIGGGGGAGRAAGSQGDDLVSGCCSRGDWGGVPVWELAQLLQMLLLALD
jgi:hypothetical protein